MKLTITLQYLHAAFSDGPDVTLTEQGPSQSDSDETDRKSAAFPPSVLPTIPCFIILCTLSSCPHHRYLHHRALHSTWMNMAHCCQHCVRCPTSSHNRVLPSCLLSDTAERMRTVSRTEFPGIFYLLPVLDFPWGCAFLFKSLMYNQMWWVWTRISLVPCPSHKPLASHKGLYIWTIYGSHIGRFTFCNYYVLASIYLFLDRYVYSISIHDSNKLSNCDTGT